MSWTWQLRDSDGAEVTPAGTPPSFPTQSDAESWLGEEWPDLLAAGVDDVVLFEGSREVYGPMSLHTPET